MKVLIAEDDKITRLMLERMLILSGYETVVTSNGAEAWRALQQEDAPQIALLDWMMPEINGLEVCRKIREHPQTRDIYTIILTIKDEQRDIIEGLEQGADDYITKPFDQEELVARIRAGVRIVKMQRSLADKIEELERALSLVKRLEGIIPICSYCKRVRNDKEYWQSVDSYISEKSQVLFSHSVCLDCYSSIVEPMIDCNKPTAHGPKEKASDLPS